MKKEGKGFRKPEKVNDLLIAACNVMGRKRYAEMSMRDIAEEAGVHKSLLYHYFKDKDELFLELFRFLNKQYMTVLTGVSNSPTSNKEKIKEITKAYQNFIEGEPKWLLIFLDLMVQSVKKPKGKTEILSIYNQIFDLTLKTVKDGRDTEEFNKDFDDKLLVEVGMAGLIGLSIFHVMDEDLIDFPKACNYLLKITSKDLLKNE